MCLSSVCTPKLRLVSEIWRVQACLVCSTLFLHWFELPVIWSWPAFGYLMRKKQLWLAGDDAGRWSSFVFHFPPIFCLYPKKAIKNELHTLIFKDFKDPCGCVCGTFHYNDRCRSTFSRCLLTKDVYIIKSEEHYFPAMETSWRLQASDIKTIPFTSSWTPSKPFANAHIGWNYCSLRWNLEATWLISAGVINGLSVNIQFLGLLHFWLVVMCLCYARNLFCFFPPACLIQSHQGLTDLKCAKSYKKGENMIHCVIK